MGSDHRLELCKLGLSVQKKGKPSAVNIEKINMAITEYLAKTLYKNQLAQKNF